MTKLLDDRYELVERIGSGGVASVHRALDRRLGREVAVKLLEDLAASQADPIGRERFVREAETAARLHHPHVVTVLDAGESDGQLFLVMQLVEGVTLAEVIAQRAPLPTETAARISIQLLSALDAAHRHDIVHRDVKPANVIIDADGDAYLTDFGIALRLGDIEDHLTAAGRVIGTPTYLAPEQATGGALGAVTDVYLAGLVLDEMLTARRAHGESPGAADAARVAARADAFDPRDIVPRTDPRLAEVVVRATSPDPANRYATAHAMIEAIAGGDVDVAPPVSPASLSAPPTATLAMPAAAAATDVIDGATDGPTGVTAVLDTGRTAGGRARPGALPPPSPAVSPDTHAQDDADPRSAWRRWMPVALVVAVLLLILVVGAIAGDETAPSEVPASTAPTEPASVTAPTTIATPVVEGGDDGGIVNGDGGGGNGGGEDNGRGNGGGNGRGNGGGRGNGRGNG